MFGLGTQDTDDGRITQVFYPVFPPDRNAGDVVAWLAANPAAVQYGRAAGKTVRHRTASAGPSRVSVAALQTA